MTYYTNQEIGKIAGISKTKVQYFVDQRVIIPAERGRGRSILYTERNLVEIMMAIVLQEYGMSIALIRNAFNGLRMVEEEKNITDFFTNVEWGREKDIMIANAWVDAPPPNTVGKGRDRTWGDIVTMDYETTEELMEKVVRIANGPITTVPLGKIKNKAMSRLKM